MGLALRTVADIENYEANPRFDTLCEVITYLNLPADSIFHPEGQRENENRLHTIINQELSSFTEDELNQAIHVLEGYGKVCTHRILTKFLMLVISSIAMIIDLQSVYFL